MESVGSVLTKTAGMNSLHACKGMMPALLGGHIAHDGSYQISGWVS